MLEACSVQPEDESFLYQVYASTREEEMKVWGWEQQAVETFLNMQFRIQQQSYHQQYPDAEHRIIFLSGSPVGQYRLNRGTEELIVVDISLLPAWRNTGLGTSLFRLWQKEAEQADKGIRLHVLRENRGRRFYERLGFISISEDGLYVEMMWRCGENGSFRTVV
jgi:ribosomal protein S18 acetylase RimI-like enzyme